MQQNSCHFSSSLSKAWVTADQTLRPTCAALCNLGEMVNTKENFNLATYQVVEVILAMHL